MGIPQHNEGYLWQAQRCQHPTQIETQSFYTKIRKRQGFPFPSYLLSIVLEALAKALRQLKKMKRIQVGKKEVQVSYLQMVWFYI